MKKYIIALSLIFACTPFSSASALGLESDKYQGIVNGLYDIGNSIDAQTKAFQDAQTRQQMAALNQECVAFANADINANSTNLKQIEQEIKDYTAQIAGKARSMEEQVSDTSHLNYLYSLIGIHKQDQTNFIIRTCSISTLNAACVKANGPHAEMKSYDASGTQCQCASGYGWSGSACVAQQAQQSAATPVSGRQCNGKSWGECPAGYKFSCPSTGNPKCVSDQPANVVDTGSSGGAGSSGGGGSASGSISCDRMVMMHMTHLGTMTEAECYTTWQKAVETAQKNNAIAPAPRSAQASQITHEAESTTEAIGTTTIADTDNRATMTPTYHKGLKRLVQDLWSWAIGLLSF